MTYGVLKRMHTLLDITRTRIIDEFCSTNVLSLCKYLFTNVGLSWIIYVQQFNIII